MQRATLIGLAALCCALAPTIGMAAAPEAAPVPWASVLALLPQMAGAPGTDRGTLALALNEFMIGLVAYLHTQGVPANALSQIQTRFAYALNAFLNAGASAAAFGEDVARLARELAYLAAHGGVQGLPAALLERIGIAAWAVDALRHGAQGLTGIEVAAIARQIAGQALANGRAPGLGNSGLPGQAAGSSPPIPMPPVIGGPPSLPGPPPGLPPVVPGPPEEDEDPPDRRAGAADQGRSSPVSPGGGASLLPPVLP